MNWDKANRLVNNLMESAAQVKFFALEIGEDFIACKNEVLRRDTLRDQIIAALCEDKWIPIPDDILPEPYKDFLVWMPFEDHKIQVGYFDHELGKDWFITELRRHPLSEVTHYQPLPEGPTEED